MSDIIRNALYPGIPVTHPDFTGASTSDGVTRFHFSIVTGVTEENAVDAAIAAYPAYVAAQQAAAATAAANKASASAMITNFDPVSSPVMDKITELQGDIRTAWDNDTWVITDIFPAMRTKLMENAALYKRYRNFLRQGFNISQAEFEGNPTPTTVAQQRNCYLAAVMFLNTGGVHSLFKVLF
jgi:hypothetical protein